MANFYKVCRSITHSFGLIILSLGLIAVCSGNAYAHRMKVFAWVDGKAIEGEVYFSGGQGAAGSTIELVADQAIVATTQSNEEGQFRFEVMAARDYLVRADAGQGHVTTYSVSATEFTPEDVAVTAMVATGTEASVQPAASSLTPAQLEQAIARAIRPLREELDQYESKVRVHDILGGMGYIFGLFGLFVLFRSRRKC
ncbi:carboxypeptidase-like regulatory domain-containing protein [Photobacterium sagamiensis]|uniref:carboxypeptidase-like regulatory domain-containing protein n=1 Tax=Photobacterium sagamiensis TaxID=2910241 RepID=UPI003D1312B3